MKQLLLQQMSHLHLQRLQLRQHWSHGSCGTHSSGAGSANAFWHLGLHLQCNEHAMLRLSLKSLMTGCDHALQLQHNNIYASLHTCAVHVLLAAVC